MQVSSPVRAEKLKKQLVAPGEYVLPKESRRYTTGSCTQLDADSEDVEFDIYKHALGLKELSRRKLMLEQDMQIINLYLLDLILTASNGCHLQIRMSAALPVQLLVLLRIVEGPGYLQLDDAEAHL
jgi:hypothetical protein